MRCGFPYQYDQSTWRARAFLVGIAARAGLAAVAARLLPADVAAAAFPIPVAFGVLDGDAYVDVWARARRATGRYRAAACVLGLGLLRRAVG